MSPAMTAARRKERKMSMPCNQKVMTQSNKLMTDYLKLSWLSLVTLFCLLSMQSVRADIFLHNPRGSNNRLSGSGRDRANNNRLFDSQNNNRGGYNQGSLYYFTGSKLSIEWTNQHSCASPNSHCDLIIQYMCQDTVRDGISTKSIPESNAGCENYDCSRDRRFGMHEDHDYYLNCKRRERNKNLFTADQNLKNRNTAKHTRQNAGGTRSGYECPEERDYYPYWHPAPWKDLAVLTNDVSKCAMYRRESQNVKSTWACVLTSHILEQNNRLVLPNNEHDCQNFCWPPKSSSCLQAKWTEFPSHGLPAPECRETEYTRDNHLGNGIGGHPNVYNWTVPAEQAHENCVLRIRYNMSTGDYDRWMTNANQNALPMAERYGFSDKIEAKNRGYVFKNNPEVRVFSAANFTLQLAMNTAQYGRTFQDRSHSFATRDRPEHIDSSSTIHNLNVRGKRGNIVQVYPSVEYDYFPNTLEISKGDVLHIQWTGSDTNNNGNDGNGRAGTDRNNILLLKAPTYGHETSSAFGPGLVYGHYGNNYPTMLNESNLLGLSGMDRQNLAFLSPGQMGGEMSLLNEAGTYFDVGPRTINQVGTFHFMCSRNNDFSNRDQKGRIIVYEYPISYHSIGSQGGEILLQGGDTRIMVEAGVFPRLQKLRVEMWSGDYGEKQVQAIGREVTVGEEYASDFLVIEPVDKLTSADKTFRIELKLSSSSSAITVYRTMPRSYVSWSPIDAQIDDSKAVFYTDRGGVFVARTDSRVGLIVGITISCLVIVAIIVVTVIYCRRHPDTWRKVKSKRKYIQRSMKADL